MLDFIIAFSTANTFICVYFLIQKMYKIKIKVAKTILFSYVTAFLYSMFFLIFVELLPKLSSVLLFLDTIGFMRFMWLASTFGIISIGNRYLTCLSYRKTLFYSILIFYFLLANQAIFALVFYPPDFFKITSVTSYAVYWHVLLINIISDLTTFFITFIFISKFNLFTNEIIDYPKINRIILKLVPLYLYLTPLIRILFMSTSINMEYINLSIFCLTLITTIFITVIILFIYTVDTENKKQKLINLHQQTYINQLENLQKELRGFKHDYKNILSGAYIQAKNENYEKLQLFFENTINDFDEQVEHQVTFLTQLANIQVEELKSLLLVKMQLIHQKNIPYHVEILYPITETSIKINDLNRCLGILIDNAIEASQALSNTMIDIILIKEKGYFSILVKNKINHDISNIEQLFKEGYSSKGKTRGIGLASYQQIINKYENVTSLTAIKDQFFVQELIIEEND